MKIPRLKAPRAVFLRHPFALRFIGIFNKVRPYTCVNYDILLQMKSILATLDKKNIPGAIVEVGCWRGGCGAFMASYAKHRKIFLYDAFDKFPPTREEDGEYVKKLNLEVAEESDVKEIFSKLKVNPIIIKGFIKDASRLGESIAVLRLDVDLYDSTTDALEKFYDQVSPGGYIIIDDFDFPGCRMAVYDFFSRRRIDATISHPSKFKNAYFIKK